MGMSEEGLVKRAAELRTSLVKRIEELETELEELRTLLQVVEEFLKEKSFKRLEAPAARAEAAEAQPAQPSPPENIIPLTTVDGVLLANMHAGDDYVRVVPAEGMRFHVATPPFQSFLIRRVLSKMQEREQEAAARGELPQDAILSYEVIQDEGGVIKAIEIRNVKPHQLRELKSTIRWTLRRMYEKTSGAAAP